ncbi:unnamed protein product [Soboliphyme baturini]|uniref:LL-diaminopimelate aminotransferase n=1 Tax=Soboliphyme baturini TaxID=241478 RepID=A0A183I9E7_9BILA|nr:unnamed protein product [Soboliphyme baturini]
MSVEARIMGLRYGFIVANKPTYLNLVDKICEIHDKAHCDACHSGDNYHCQ